MTSKEALEKLNMNCIHSNGVDDEYSKEYNIIKKDLDVLEIIKNKKVDVSLLKLMLKELFTTLRYARIRYNEAYYEKYHLTQEEFEKLVEWLGNE